MKSYDTFSPTIPQPEEKEKKDFSPVETASPTENVKPKKNKKTKSDERKQRGETYAGKVIKFFRSEHLRWIIGLFFGILCLYLAISFISYFSNNMADQSEILNTPVGYSAPVSNQGGESGARLGELLINETFGLGSIVILIWLAAFSLKLLVGRPKFRGLDFTLKCIVGLICISLIVGLLTIGMDSTVNWGGYHGRYVNEFIIHFLGWTGAVMLCLFAVGVFVIICFRDVIKWIIKKKEKYNERKRQEALKRKEALERERELEEMRRFENLSEPQTEEIDDENNNPVIEGNLVFDEKVTGFYDNMTDFGVEEYSLPEEEQFVPETDVLYPGTSIDINQGTNDDDDIVDITEGYDENVLIKEDDYLNEDDNTSETIVPDEESSPMEISINEIGETKAKRTIITAPEPGSFPYKFPPYDLLAEGKGQLVLDPEEQQENKDKIEKTLLDFKIPITSIRATIGPTVTLYEIVPDKGVKVASIKRLVDDIALSLSAEGVRIIAPIPGKGTVGIEVANKKPQMVSMRTIIKSKAFQENDFKLPVAIGSTISNEVYITDLAKMPHLLVAGATGQGKSVGLNAVIASLLYSKRPDELKFVMIDPKMVEFSLYEKIESHYLAKIPGEDEAIITNMDKAVATLNSLVIEMENRYKKLKDIHTKNIIEYNNKIKTLSPVDRALYPFLPYIVVVVDEFADLIMNIGRDVEMPIARLAQKARAVGIHVIIATQRPSADVITGMIKGNFPARMAFKVASGIDSKTILDTTGAQYLIGKGDMLILNSSPLIRVQCAFIDTPEVEAICEYIYNQPYGQGAYELPEPIEQSSESTDAEGGNNFGDKDVLFDDAARLVVSSNHASTSALQRHFSIGYNRAGKIMDQMEASGIVGPSQGGKPRSVLVDILTLEKILGYKN